MDYYTYKEEVLKLLNGIPSDFSLEVETVEYGGKITAFFALFETEQQLEKAWTEIFGTIAIQFQKNLSSDYERWNIYVFYLVKGDVSHNLKYKIENNIVSSRKIVIERYTHQTHKEIIAEHITNENLLAGTIGQERSSTETFLKSDLLWTTVRTIPAGCKKKEYNEYIKLAVTNFEKAIENEI